MGFVMLDKDWLKQRLPDASKDEIIKFIELVGKFMYDAGMDEAKAREFAF